MKRTWRRLALLVIAAVTLVWATRPGSGSASQAGQETKPKEACSSVECAVDAPVALSVAAGSCRNFHASGEVFRSHVADSEIAQFVHNGPSEVGIRGLKPGKTSVTIWSAATKKPVTLEVEVTEDADGPEIRQTGLDDADDGPAIASSQGKPIGADGPALRDEPESADDVVQTGAKAQTSQATQTPIDDATPRLAVPANTSFAPQVPAITLETSGPVMATVGKIVEQQIVVRNVGSAAAEQVEVRGTMSIDAELISTEPRASISESTMVWRIARLAAGSEHKIIVRVKPVVAGELTCFTNVSFKSSTAAKVQVNAAKLKLICEGPAAATVGSDVTVTMTVINTGSAAAENVRIRQIVPAIQQTGGAAAAKPLLLEVGTLEPGESRVLETSSKATAPGLVLIKLVAEARDAVPATAEHSLKVQQPKLAITTTGPDFRYLNRKATYQVVVANTGDATVTNLNVMVGLPEGLEFVDASHDGAYNAQKRTIAWTPGTLDAGRKTELSLTVTPRSEGEHLQRAVAWADNNLLVKADKVTRVEGLVALAMEVNDVEDPIEIGSDTLYQIHITNKGSKTAERVQVIAMVADGLKVTGVESPGTYRVQGQQLVFEPIASVAPQATAAIQVRVKGTKAGTHAIRAMLSCQGMSNTIVTEESTAVYGD